MARLCRNGTPDLAQCLEITQQNHGVGQIGDVDRCFHISDKPMLCDGQECVCSLPIQILQQFMDVEDKGVLLRHGRLVTVEAVDHHRFRLRAVDAVADAVGKLAGRQFRGVDLLDMERPRVTGGFEIETHGFCAIEQQPEFLVKREEGGSFTAPDRSGDELEDEQAFAGAGRAEH